MSSSKKMVLRVQSAEGTTRVEVLDTDVTAQLFERVHEGLHLNTFAFALHKDRQRKEEVISSKSRRLTDCGLHHGDMLYLSPVNGAVLFDQPTDSVESNNKPFGEPVVAGPSSSSAGLAPVTAAPRATTTTPQEDEVDLQLYQLSGNIQRQRDDKLCRHNSKGCCVHCSPLEPWDESYLKEHNIKHMSFHAYLRKITSGNFISLDELSCKIKPGCTEHPPWPRGICSACQPGAVTLNRQPYRHVDNVLFENPAVVERFLAYWRATGHQRLGFLYGRYERHPDVPLGIRARVSAIYEPPQSGSRDGLALAADAREPLLAELAARLGLRRVGWIFTDLLPLDAAAGTVQRVRGVDTHFLAAQECIMAGHYQNEHPNACRHASSGYFGSKFVTVCVTGDSDNRVHLEGYQVSGQCQALVRDGVLLPTRDAPELGYTRDSSDRQYVPDVYYKERDAYGNEVGVSAKRVPVAYLLVDVPCGVAAPAAAAPPAPADFPPAHRPLQHQLQTPRALLQHLQAADSFLEVGGAGESSIARSLARGVDVSVLTPPGDVGPARAAVPGVERAGGGRGVAAAAAGGGAAARRGRGRGVARVARRRAARPAGARRRRPRPRRRVERGWWGWWGGRCWRRWRRVDVPAVHVPQRAAHRRVRDVRHAQKQRDVNMQTCKGLHFLYRQSRRSSGAYWGRLIFIYWRTSGGREPRRGFTVGRCWEGVTAAVGRSPRAHTTRRYSCHLLISVKFYASVC